MKGRKLVPRMFTQDVLLDYPVRRTLHVRLLSHWPHTHFVGFGVQWGADIYEKAKKFEVTVFNFGLEVSIVA